jgi:hypothetical protein
MTESTLFVNEGFGWECKRCLASVTGTVGAAGREDPATPAGATGAEELPRFFREGEAEEREPRLASHILARWHDTPNGRALRCPRCGAEEVPPDKA